MFTCYNLIMISDKERILLYIIGSSMLSVALVGVRSVYTGLLQGFQFLIWNLFLAWIPFILSIIIFKYFNNRVKFSIFFLILLFLWLIFLPNTYYILTDFIHLRDRKVIGLWYDLLLIGSFAINGFILGLSSTFLIHRTLLKKYGTYISWVMVILSFFLASFGVYLGRFLRWNSWDILSNPGDLAGDIALTVINPIVNGRTYAITLILFSILTTLYLIIWEFYKIVSKNKL
jgi:uncharacterized membrane protein